MTGSFTQTTTRAKDLYRSGGLSELSRGIFRKFTFDIAPWTWTLWHRYNGGKPVGVSLGENEYQFHPKTPSELARFKTLMGEGLILEDLLENLQPEDTIWDIGANIGLYTVPCAHLCQTVAFDPVPANMDRVKTNLELNNLSADLHTIALGDEERTTTIHVPENDVGGTSTIVQQTGGKRISATVKPGDGLTTTAEPTVLKIDVEGAEMQVLKGLTDTLENVRLIYIEVHPEQLQQLDSSSQEVLDLLENAGFTIQRLSSRSEANSHLKAIRE